VIRTLILWIRQNITRRPKRIGERNGVPLYRCWCTSHGYFEDITTGWDKALSCPMCFRKQFGEVSEI